MVLEDQGKVTGQAESIIGEDKRKLVPADDFKTGGKYRDQGDEDNRWAMGSGSLIRHDIVVTAGHCVYDWANGMGRAVRINAYIGYNGRDSVKNKDADVQLRRGLRVATTAGWLASSSNRTSDVAFIKLDSGFTGITSQLVHHMPTPVKGAEILGIVGYPGDKFKKDKNGKEEKGAQMYEAWEHTEWNLETSTKNMLSYTISTAGGQSGSAVLRASSTYRTSIGAHTYGGSYSNSASPIAGQYGNVYSAYVSVVDDPKPVVVTTKKNVNYVSVSALDSQEGFLDTGRDIAKIASNIASTVLTTGSPFLGPVVGPLAAVAGAALGYVGSLCESTMGNDTTAESAIESIEQNPIMHRAILGEAVLQSLGSIRDESRLNAIYSRMDAYYQRNAPGIFKIGPTVLSALGADSQAGAGELTDKGEKKKIEYTMTESESLKGSRKAFLKKLLEDSPQVGESFFNGELGNILVGGIQCPDTIAQHSRTGLCYLGSIVAPTHMGVDLDDMDEAQQLLLRRSVLSQAALDAVIHENKLCR
ncbi:hypothetical protein B0I35DRAFT_159651 [Stachybotrys elegans]|uniref:Serine protease n=1 Tax=Stachybotrys elegans TaxID=80388 RepID=A0A8K0WUS7_9HYPO|nr:hypothetical protein B0I35DRAFT_159651 [Stachybotrys elegans]